MSVRNSLQFAVLVERFHRHIATVFSQKRKWLQVKLLRVVLP